MLVVSSVVAYLAGLRLLWSLTIWRIVMCIIPGLLGLWMLFPSSPLNVGVLRKQYVVQLHQFEGTRYWWGGENRRGIDCSGLVRRALQDAYVVYGFRYRNSEAFRRAFSLWWHDMSAKALGNEGHGTTRRFGIIGTVNTLDHTHILPGDIAVTLDGVHCLVYLGERQWIQAEPILKQVMIFPIPSENSWYRTPVNVVRWSVLSEPT